MKFNSNVPISFKSLLYLIIAFIITLLLLFFSLISIYEIAKSGENWIEVTIGSVGNIAGGFIGGIVAYLVAAFQVNKANESQHKVNIRGFFAIMRLLKEELEYNELVIDSVLPYTGNPSENELLSEQINVTQWNNNSTNIGIELSDDDFFMLCDLYRNLSIIKAKKDDTKNSQFLEDTKSTIQKALDKIDKLIRDLRTDI